MLVVDFLYIYPTSSITDSGPGRDKCEHWKKAPRDPSAQKSTDFQVWMTELVEDSRGYKHKFIDTHCHIDQIYNNLNLKPQGLTYSQFRSEIWESWPENYEGCVTVFSNPWIFISGASTGMLLICFLNISSE